MKRKIYLFLLMVMLIFSGCSFQNNNTEKYRNNVETPNVYTVSDKVESVAIYDGKTDKIVGKAFKSFSISFENEKDGKAYFSININDPSNLDETNTTSFYLYTKDLQKVYKEIPMVIEIISLDAIVLSENIPIYDSEDNCIAKFDGKLGPIRYIQKTDKGYQLMLAQNLVYIKEEDVSVLEYKDK